jgi:nucleotide-binding universal stress UspA family protein
MLRRYRERLQVDAMLVARPIDAIERIVALGSSGIDYPRFVGALAALHRATGADIELVYSGEDADARAERELLAEGLVGRLGERGVPCRAIETFERTDVPDEDPEKMADRLADADLVVLARRPPTLGEQLLGPVRDTVSEEADRPTLVIDAPD